MVGGKETGQHMDHYTIPGGRFEQVYDKLSASSWRLNLESAHRPGEQKGPSSKTKFSCPQCREQNVWGNPTAASTATTARCACDRLLDRTIEVSMRTIDTPTHGVLPVLDTWRQCRQRA
jgi:hypothetical protein